MVRVKLDGVTKRFGRVVAVNNVSLEMPEGKLTVLLGPSGSGKTTLLYLIAGIYKPTSGRIYFDDEDVTELPPSRRNVGLVFQNYALYPHMTVFQNIAFPLRLKKLPEDEIERKVREAAKLLKIEVLLNRYPSQLSGGQQQRVALARALVKEPSVLLLDEPLSNLDALLRIYIRAEIKRLQADLGITAIYVTHDQSEAMAIADQVVVMNAGVVQQVGDPKEVYSRPRTMFVASFIGNPPANMMRGLVVDSKVKVFDGELVLEDQLLRKIRDRGIEDVVVAFRPEHVEISREPLEGHLSMSGEIYAVEPLGRETIITALVKGEVVKAVKLGKVDLKIGEMVYLNIRPDHVKMFDPSTELNLEYL